MAVEMTGALDVPRSPGGEGEVVWAGGGLAQDDQNPSRWFDRSEPSRARTNTGSSTRSFGAAPHKRRTINSLTTLAPFRLAEAPGRRRMGTEPSRPGAIESEKPTSTPESEAWRLVRELSRSQISGQQQPFQSDSVRLFPPPPASASRTTPRPSLAITTADQFDLTTPVPSVQGNSRVASSASVATQPSVGTAFTASSEADEGLFFLRPAGGSKGQGGGRERLRSGVEELC